MKQFYSEEMLEMICNYGRYEREYIPISGSRWRFRLHRSTGLHNITREGGRGGYHIMAVRHDNVVQGTGCHTRYYILNIDGIAARASFPEDREGDNEC